MSRIRRSAFMPRARSRRPQIRVGRRFAVAHDRCLHRRVAALALRREEGPRLDHAIWPEDGDVLEHDTYVRVPAGQAP